MANSFSKEERVAFEDMLQGFEDMLAMSDLAKSYRVGDSDMVRSNDIIWRPQPYIAQSFDGMDQSANFKTNTQLSVPATIGFLKSVPWSMDAKELRDALQENRIYDSAKQKLASDINRAILDVAVDQGTLVVAQSTASAGFGDVALCEAIMNEQGIDMYDRKLVYNTRDYNGAASNLASRSTMTGLPEKAYRGNMIGHIASFDTYKLDYSKRVAAAGGGGGLTISTLDGVNDYTPSATSTAATGETSNVDNRRQQVTISSTTGVVAGDAFTIATLNAVHHITKQDTDQLKTFRVISVDSATTMTISPPIITNQVASDASAQYQNCTIGTKAANSAIVFLNTTAAQANPFWQKDAIEILPARLAIQENAGVGIMRATTKQGIEVVMQKFQDVNTNTTKYRADVLFGVVNKQPEMSGIMLFGQV